jgi:hypothetical protein
MSIPLFLVSKTGGNHLRKELFQYCLAFIRHVQLNVSNKLHVMAACIAVSQFTEETTLMFHRRNGHELFRLSVRFAFEDDGFLYRLVTQLERPRLAAAENNLPLALPT